jgi:hypothetical protein
LEPDEPQPESHEPDDPQSEPVEPQPEPVEPQSDVPVEPHPESQADTRSTGVAANATPKATTSAMRYLVIRFI